MGAWRSGSAPALHVCPPSWLRKVVGSIPTASSEFNFCLWTSETSLDFIADNCQPLEVERRDPQNLRDLTLCNWNKLQCYIYMSVAAALYVNISLRLKLQETMGNSAVS